MSVPSAKNKSQTVKIALLYIKKSQIKTPYEEIPSPANLVSEYSLVQLSQLEKIKCHVQPLQATQKSKYCMSYLIQVKYNIKHPEEASTATSSPDRQIQAYYEKKYLLYKHQFIIHGRGQTRLEKDYRTEEEELGL